MNRQQALLLSLGIVAIAFAAGQYSARLTFRAERVSAEQFAEALESRDWVYRAHTISSYVRDLGPENLPAALAAVEARRRWLSQDELRLFMGAWASFDPEAAFARSLTWPDHTRNKGAAAAIYGWALHNPKAAHRAAMTTNDSNLKALLLDRLVAAWAHGEDREGATLYIAGLPNEPSRSRLTSVLVREILADGHGAVMAWAEGLPDGNETGFRSTAYERTAGILAQDDHRAAVKFVERNRDTPEIEGAFAAVARRWVSTDPEAALAWARSLPPGSGRDRAVRIGFVQWQKKNPTAAERWLLATEASPELDPARFVVVRRLAATAPLEAIGLAQTIQDPETKERGLIAVLTQWLQVEHEAATAWLAQNPTPERVRKAIQAHTQPGRRRVGNRQVSPGARPSPGEPSETRAGESKAH